MIDTYSVSLAAMVRDLGLQVGFASTDYESIRLTVEERDCSDPMSGEQFRAAATLVVDGEEYAGCGSWLAAD